MRARGRKRPWGSEHVPLDTGALLRGGARTETDRDGRRWTVREVSGATKTYRCPGCGGDVAAGSRHVVAWTDDHLFGTDAGVAERRHWHGQCWRARR